MGPDKVTSRATIMDRGRREMSRRRCRSVFFRYSAFDKARRYTRLYVTLPFSLAPLTCRWLSVMDETSLLRATLLDTTSNDATDPTKSKYFAFEFNTRIFTHTIVPINIPTRQNSSVGVVWESSERKNSSVPLLFL